MERPLPQTVSVSSPSSRHPLQCLEYLFQADPKTFHGTGILRQWEDVVMVLE